MNKAYATMVMAGICSAASMSNASIAITEDLGIFSPCDDAQVEVIWIGSDSGFTGELSWVNPFENGTNIALWTNHSADVGDSFILPGRFALGERIDFSYEITAGQLDFFSTANEADWAQFKIDASNPLDVVVGIEDTRFPGGDNDHNDAMFRVVFSHPVPTPGSLALLGAGGLMMTKRRR